MSKKVKVYLNKDHARNRLLIRPQNLYAVMTLNWLFDPAGSGLPPELVEKIYDDHRQLRLEFKEEAVESKFHVLYVSVEDVEETIYLMQAISVFNRVAEVPVSIYCSKKAYREVKAYSNDHIDFYVRGQQRPAIPPVDLVITFGPGALHFIRQGIPVMIIGPYGFGGLVTPEFLPFLVRCGFMGRPGGSYSEPIPEAIVREELLQIKCNKLSTVAIALRDAASKLPFLPLSGCNEVVKRAKQLHRRLYNKTMRRQLVPRIASNVEMERRGELCYVKRKCINDTLAVINHKKLVFFNKIDANADCSVLHAQSGLTEEDFWKYIYVFWEKKIIVF